MFFTPVTFRYVACMVAQAMFITRTLSFGYSACRRRPVGLGRVQSYHRTRMAVLSAIQSRHPHALFAIQGTLQRGMRQR